MVEVRACVYFFVLFLSFHVTVGKPFFGLVGYCELLCEDDDPATTTTSTSTEDFYDELWCGWCEPRRPRTTTTPAPTTLASPSATANPGVPPFNVVIHCPKTQKAASATATNLTLWRPNGMSGWFMNMMPWNMGAPAGAGPPAPPGPPAPTAAPLVATTGAAAAGETPAPAAGAATTAAPAA